MEQYLKRDMRLRPFLGAQTRADFNKIEQETSCFIPCKIRIKGDRVNYLYDMSGLTKGTCLFKDSMEKKVVFLKNMCRLELYFKHYKIPLALDNLYYDQSLRPYILHRDLYSENEKYIRENQMLQFQCVASELLSGNKIGTRFRKKTFRAMMKNKIFRDLYVCADMDQMTDMLDVIYQKTRMTKKEIAERKRQILDYQLTFVTIADS